MINRQDINMCLAIERITFANREAYRVMSENMEEFVGNPTHEVYEQILSVREQMCKLFKTLKERENAAYEREHSRILAHVPIEDRQGKLF